MLGLPILAEIKENVFFSSSLVQKNTYVEAPGLNPIIYVRVAENFECPAI